MTKCKLTSCLVWLYPVHGLLGQTRPSQLLLHLGQGLAFHECLGLGQEVAQEELVVLSALDVVVRVDRRDEVCRDELGALVDQLVEGVLSVRAGFTPNDGAGGIVDLVTRTSHIPTEKNA